MTAIANDLVDEALQAFRVDASYAVSIARMAVVIIKKRSNWQSRQVRQHEPLDDQGVTSALLVDSP